MRQQTTTRRLVRLGLLAASLILIGGAPAAARERIRQQMTPVADADADARGVARLALQTDDRGRFEVRVFNLEPNATYEILVGDVRVGSLTTKGGGFGRVRFRSRPRGHDLLLGFDPRGQIVVVRSAAGADVLSATVPTGTGVADGDVICCVPDDSGSECEDRTADECAARGGTVSTATSCLPNPCADAPPVDTDIVCCLPDDSGPECEDRTVAECAAQGGLAVQATSCASNPCAGTPAEDGDIVCCVPDDGGTECEDRTPAECIARSGVDMGTGSCTPNPCTGASTGGGADHGGQNGGGHGRGGDDAAGDDSASGSRGGGNRPAYYGTTLASDR